MSFFVLFLAAFQLCLSYADQTTFDCKMRSLAVEFATQIQPNLSTRKIQEICDALNGAPDSRDCHVSPSDLQNHSQNVNFKHAHKKHPENRTQQKTTHSRKTRQKNGKTWIQIISTYSYLPLEMTATREPSKNL